MGKYKRALFVACDLLNGSYIYGVDTDKIFKYCMEKDGFVTVSSYHDFILKNINRFSDNDKKREKAIKKLGW